MIKGNFFGAAFSCLSLAGCASLSSNSHSFTVQKNVAYSPADSSPKTVDIYRPRSKGKAPAVIVLHGGGWARRSGDMTFICTRLAREGFVALNATYGLAPNELYPKPVHDIRSVIAWVNNNADSLNIDRDRIYLWGYSAGGHLALLTGLDPDQKIRGIVAGGTPADLTVYPRSPLVNKFLGVPRDGNENLWREASPIFAVKKDSPPVFMYHGALDILVEVDQMNRMAATLREAGVPVETHKAPLLGHISVYLFNSASIEKGIRFLKETPTR